MPSDLRSAIEALVQEYSTDEIVQELRLVSDTPSGSILTIIVNAGLHAVPSQHLRGEIYNFSIGNIQLSAEEAEQTIQSLCQDASKFIRKQRWTSIYVIPTGHPALSIAISLLVFRLTRIEPIIVSYFGEEGYKDIHMDIRRIALRHNARIII